MKPFNKLDLGFGDAENYQHNDNKEKFNQIFVRNDFLENLMKLSTYFLIGEKGTGKTAYAVYLANNDYKNTISDIKFIRETDYDKFIYLKESNNLRLTDYVNIWKVILLLLIASSIKDKEIKKNIFKSLAKFNKLKAAINEYYQSTFSSEIMNSFYFIENSEDVVDLFSSYFDDTLAKDKNSISSTKKFQKNLLFIQNKFQESFQEISLLKNKVLFIDGIDIRPGSIKYENYLECIKGLANAIWSLNNDFFAKIKDTQGRIRVVLLIRPDILNSLNLQNLNNKINDNSVFLDWRTTYPEYRNSELFKMIDKILIYNQVPESNIKNLWDHYNPWQSPSTNSNRDNDDSFINILKICYSRPRDIITCLQMLQNLKIQNKDDSVITYDDFHNDSFKNNFSDYLLGGIKDQLSFYYSSEDYEMFLHFFKCLRGKSDFNYKEYTDAYKEFTDYFLNHHDCIPEFTEDEDKFLQFLYDSNVVCYYEFSEKQEKLFNWCYRERSMCNLKPKVRPHANYRIHYGLHKALSIGSRLK